MPWRSLGCQLMRKRTLYMRDSTGTAADLSACSGCAQLSSYKRSSACFSAVSFIRCSLRADFTTTFCTSSITTLSITSYIRRSAISSSTYWTSLNRCQQWKQRPQSTQFYMKLPLSRSYWKQPERVLPTPLRALGKAFPLGTCHLWGSWLQSCQNYRRRMMRWQIS